MDDRIAAALQGDRRALARLISAIEDDPTAAGTILQHTYPLSGGAHVIGVTGAPGSGKSSLVTQLAVEYRRRERTVAIVAVDPTSPFSGGAILGDRIRARALSGDPGVYFRSMATRGSLGGLARQTGDVVSLLDSCGYARILVETVGAGQSEVDIAGEAHTTLVLQTPGAGDDVQSLKAGILEIADILVVNKADLDGAAQMASILFAMLELGQPRPAPSTTPWQIPIVRTIATQGEGTGVLVDAIERHVAYLAQSGARERLERERAARRVRELLQSELLRECVARVGEERLEQVSMAVAARQGDPYTAAESLLREGVGWLPSQPPDKARGR